jgi:hypothetical protein
MLSANKNNDLDTMDRRTQNLFWQYFIVVCATRFALNKNHHLAPAKINKIIQLLNKITEISILDSNNSCILITKIVIYGYLIIY